MIRVAIANEQDRLTIDDNRLRAAVERICRDAGLADAEISVAIVDDPTIHRLNRQFLEHDYPTDVISFVLEAAAGRLEGEIVASADTAIEQAARLGWPPQDELLLYVAHGALHLVGYDDLDAESAARMRQRERQCLAEFGLVPPNGPGDDVLAGSAPRERTPS